MRVFRFVILRIRDRLSEKLGVCPFCMRASALGSIASWTAYAVARAADARWPLPSLFPILILIVAIAFTALIIAHLTAYMIRVAGRVRCRERARAAEAPNARVLSRREFFGLVLRAGAYAATISLLGRVPAFAQANGCAGLKGPDPRRTERGSGNSKDAAKRAFRANAETFCDGLCEDLDCGADGGCVRDGAPVLSEPDCYLGVLGAWHCSGEVKQCSCGCKKCKGDHDPLVYGDSPGGFGLSDAEARAQLLDAARAKCDKVCARNTDCAPPPTCKRIGEPVLAEIKSWKHASNIWEASARLKKCKCDCA